MIAFTGHRRLVNHEWVRDQLDITVQELAAGDSHFCCGGALGFDQLFMDVVLHCGYELTVARPFPSQSSLWLRDAQERYRELLSRVSHVIDVNGDPYAGWKMQARNVWIVDHSSMLIAVFDGSPGGTKNCYEYAMKKGKTVYRIDPLKMTCSDESLWNQYRVTL